MKRGHGDVFGGMGKNLLGLRVCCVNIWKVMSKKLRQNCLFHNNFIYSLFKVENLQIKSCVQMIHGYIHKNMVINVNFQKEKTLYFVWKNVSVKIPAYRKQSTDLPRKSIN